MTHFAVVKIKAKVYYKVIRRSLLWAQEFKICGAGIQYMTYFLESVCLPPKINTGSAPQPNHVLAPLDFIT